MANPVQLRALTRGERRLLRAKLKELSLSARVHQRYRITQSGLATFEQVPNPKGRPPILQASRLRELVDVALSSLTERGLPFSAWSVPKLAAYCCHPRVLPPVTAEGVRRLLRREGLS